MSLGRHKFPRISLSGLKLHAVRLFPAHEIYVRSNGQVRFLKISTDFQLKAAAVACGALGAWLVISGGMLLSQYRVHLQEVAIGARARAVERAVVTVEAYRDEIDGMAGQLEARQQFLDTLGRQYFGGQGAEPGKSVVAAPVSVTAYAAVPGASRLAALEHRQLAFAEWITTSAMARAARTEKAVRRLGLNPQTLTRPAQGVGGPLVPFGEGARSGFGDPRFLKLYAALVRLDSLERAVLVVPSFKPAPGGALSSGFGFRFDPFTRWPALHMGQDFSGTRGLPIHAAAPGRVVRAGRWGGYGNAVEIDHGRGLRTRYGHLSAFDVKPGDRVERGALIGRMGSTGRSTGNHLHFEVRNGGRAVNPRPFLEASSDVLEIQTSIKQRIVGTRGAG